MPLLPRPDLRSLLPLTAGCLLAASLSPAAAGPAPPAVDLGTEIKFKLRIPDEDGDFVERQPEDVPVLEYMNLANCSCGEDRLFEVEFSLEPVVNESDLPSLPVEVWTGGACAQELLSETSKLCFDEPDFAEPAELLDLPTRRIPVRHLFRPIDGGDECDRSDAEKRNVYAIIDEGRDGFGEGDYKAALAIEGDTLPPPEPTDVKARGGEEAIDITWDRPTRNDDTTWYQVLCARVDNPTDRSEFDKPETRYTTSQMACNANLDGACPRAPASSARVIAAGGPDAGTEIDAGSEEPDAGPVGECVTGLPGGLDTLDPAYLCGETQGSSVRIEGLENGTKYHIVLIAVDAAGNPTALDLGEATPEPATDFWEDYKGSGGRAKGGCSAGQAGVGGALGLVLAMAFGFGLRSAKRRRRSRRGPGSIAGGAVILLLALSPRISAAQPWWEGYDDPVPEASGPTVPHWGLELKLGPYVPDVDSEFDDSPGPFERMFGDGPFLMSQITLDRYLFYPMGQLGVSLSLGFLTRSANAFKMAVGDEPPDRSVGDTTTFRLFPASVGVVYRYTQLDDQLRIPIVPYGRAGLSYYYWLITKPSGDVAVVDGDKGRGGSLGWQATGGLAVRIERIDPDAEVSLRSELGIEHAGLVAEFTYAKVDGFGSNEKLRVGDATWFGGINFEF